LGTMGPKRRDRNFIYGVWGTLFALVLAVGVVGGARAASPAILLPDPLSLGLKPGEAGKVALRVQGVENLYGLEVHLSFDPALVEVVDADPAKPGVQIGGGDFLPNGFVAVNNADNATGRIDYAVTLLNPAEPVSGEGVLAAITFEGKANGSSPLKIDKAILASREASEIPSQTQDGVVGVSAGGKAPPAGGAQNQTPAAAASSPTLIVIAALAVLVFLAAIAMLVMVLRRKRS